MGTEVKMSFGTDDDQTKLVFVAKQIASLVGAPDGLIIKVSINDYGIIKNGAIVDLPVADVPDTFLLAFTNVEGMENPPKYPYALELKETKSNVKHP